MCPRWVIAILLGTAVASPCHVEYRRVCRAAQLKITEIQLALNVLHDSADGSSDVANQVRITQQIAQESLEQIADLCR